MGYAVYEDRAARDSGVERWAGYGVPGICDEPGCSNRLVMGRGLGNQCEYRYDEDDLDTPQEEGCSMYFCGEHLAGSCPKSHDDYTPKPDTNEWIEHMLTDDSWGQWRDENPTKVQAMKAGE